MLSSICVGRDGEIYTGQVERKHRRVKAVLKQVVGNSFTGLSSLQEFEVARQLLDASK
jgi:hypothetical protein